MSFRWTIARLYSRIAPSNRGAYALARWARKSIAKERWAGTFTTPGGTTLRLDIGTYPDCSMALDLYETETYALLRRLLRPGAHFVDCGANLGYFTLRAAKLVGPAGRVDAFEPDAQNRQRLQAHLKLNHAENVRVHPLAVSNETKELTFFHPQGALNHGQASAYASLVPGGSEYHVQAVRLDEAIDRAPDLIKIDVEGAELSAIQGAEKLLRAPNPPALIIEHNHESAAAAGYPPSEIYRALKTIQPRYRIYWIGWRTKEIPTPEDLDAIARQGNILVKA
jgi:FkbM family methyltransferase